MNANKNLEARATAAPTQLHKDFAEWLFIQTGVKVDLKTVQLVTVMRHDFQKSEENQKALAARKASAAKAKKASAAKKAAKLAESLAKVVEEPKVEDAYKAGFEQGRALGLDHAESVARGIEARRIAEIKTGAAPAAPEKLTVVYGNNEPQVHRFGCADLKKMTARQGYTKETAMVSTHSELTHLIYADMIDSNESSLDDNYMGYNFKPCCPALGK